MLRKKETLTICTPIPGFIPRQLAIDILHSHSEVITLNPLVLSHKAIPAPRTAAADEYYSTWYEITERIQYIPGMGRVGSGKITFNGCFHDMPWGLQTHIYAPMNIDLRNRYRIQGNQPGIEPPEHPEIGLEELGAPKEGLYLKEDVEIKCNIAMMGFVKAEMKRASKEMVARMIKKAELIDSGALKAMFENGRIKTLNPADRSHTSASGVANPSNLAPQGLSPNPSSPQAGYIHPQHTGSYAQSQYSRPATASSQGGCQGAYQQNPYAPHATPPPQTPQQLQPLQSHPALQPQVAPPVPQKSQQAFPMELPGDYYYAQQSPNPQYSQPPPGYAPNAYRNSTASTHSSDPRWSNPHASYNPADQRASVGSFASSGGMASPGFGHPGFAAELPSHNETTEEHGAQKRRY